MLNKNKKGKSFIEMIPHPLALLFYIVIFAAILTYIIPAGSYEREVIDGASRTIPGTYESVAKSPVGFFDIFTAIPVGFKKIADIVFIVFAAAMMFGIMEKTHMLENTVGTFVKKLGLKKKFVIVGIMTYVYGVLGIFVGYENNIALVPIAVVISLAIGGDVVLGAGMAIGGISVGFGLAPFNPYTVGIGHKIAEMPLFSGYLFRSGLVFILLTILVFYNIRYFKKILKDQDHALGKNIDTTGLQLSKPIAEYNMRSKDIQMLLVFVAGLGVMLFGVFTKGWYINEISAVFLIVGIVNGIVARLSVNEISETFSKALEPSALAAILIGVAQAIQIVMNQGNISDTIAYNFVSILEQLPTLLAVVFMSITQSVINIFIPGGSGQALVTLPIMIPVGDMIGITRQSAILAFQIGDGLTNIVTPTLGGLMAMLGLCRVPYGRWLKYILPYTVIGFVICWAALILSVIIKWGPM
ncbi:YfcC family protein [Crassaminicella profunda]|uniref:YfcC family protein n=1 Tax=Crassaminicella profunda TaxID=1286698 RepID=UPI001CA6B512|nr:AbgT family transporter [Crassaminicella profunda]QZY54408.1 AbgT family transporter [Crassaminicella profunda]